MPVSAATPTRPRGRSSREMAVRGGLAVLALALGYISTTQTLAYTSMRGAPERAHALAPGDGRISAYLAQRQTVAGGLDKSARARIDALALDALAKEPLAVPALTALAVSAEIRGEKPLARRLIAQSDRLSRRELGARLWLIEDAVTRGDISTALRHYDIALRTSREASGLLFPVLAGAIADTKINAGLADIMAKRPAWSDAFIAYLGESSRFPAASATLFRQLAARGVAVGEGAQAGLVNALIAAGRFNDAWSYYKTSRPGAARDRSRDPEFTTALTRPSLFDWLPVTLDPGVNASIRPDEKGGLFDFTAPATVGGIVLQQLELLPVGAYRIEGLSADIEQPAGSGPYWQLVCADGREIGRVDLPRSSAEGSRFAGGFTVPAGCPAQTLRLVARPSSGVAGVSGQIERVALLPARAAR